VITYRQFLKEASLAFNTYTSPEDAFEHALKLGFRDQTIEDVIKTDPEYALKYAEEVVRSRWPEAEEVMKSNVDVWNRYQAFLKSLNENSKAGGTYFSSPENAFLYCKKMKRRIPEAEELIKNNAHYAGRYADEIIHGRWPEAEEVIKKSGYQAGLYARLVIEDRWPEAERYIVHPGMTYCNDYRLFLSKLPFSKKIGWLKKEGFTDHLFWLLGIADDISPALQEYVIQKRPDLIGKFKQLNPRIAKRYQHEKELGNVDL
jgi:hypothetical protein